MPFPGNKPKPPAPPPPAPGMGALSLRRRPRPAEYNEASDEAREQIARIVSTTRAPFGQKETLISSEQAEELHAALRQLEEKLAERERLCGDLEAKLADKERELAET